MRKPNRKIDVIIPAYNVPDKILFRCLSSIFPAVLGRADGIPLLACPV